MNSPVGKPEKQYKHQPKDALKRCNTRPGKFEKFAANREEGRAMTNTDAGHYTTHSKEWDKEKGETPVRSTQQSSGLKPIMPGKWTLFQRWSECSELLVDRNIYVIKIQAL